ncbi:hypothetical protein OCL88_01070 [Paenarthrobacter sp. PAE-2]|uniref:hypothetical protein n=1 Tax=Paenarthrobacter sp. PAE-2 TaxID=2982532 RepID=UPI00222E76BD|nr:hypothetical protein [Paenarthrobacter sp. PAE-2]MCW3765052.1 hypothetical protein [Paenarthrobacter sp. PAE-2]
MSTSSERYLANFIHERLWARMNEQVLHEDLLVQIVDKEPKREMVVPFGNANFVVRYKRHLPGDRISSYPTDGARSFWSTDDALPTMELIPLAMGYMWHADERKMGDALISYRDRMDKPVWCIRLGEIEEGTTEITWTPVEPNLPALDLSQVVAASEQQRGS